ncbi:hypothetical protein HJC23_003506 [Cyclotella cryptica]|uniref:Helicase-associated domain-containing protein n=1 Tax=Cyclotella cryptica TaxID=29204 RepID=A0ABD3PAI7_9STRA|eukprot:CCRYP_016346-RA/>CCRYP_016346-RA protein AED:0.23 eAED:0.23 QI:0/-1/0/1/-1/1/1/0/481
MEKANCLKVNTVKDTDAFSTEDVSTRTRELGPTSFESHRIKYTHNASSLSSVALLGNSDMKKFASSSSSGCVTCSESRTAADRRRSDSGWNSDEKLEYLVEAGDFCKTIDEAHRMLVLNNAGSIEKMKGEISFNAPLFEDSLSFEEFTGAESVPHKHIIESDIISDQSVTSDVSFSFGSSTIDPLSSTFPSSDDDAYFPAENVDCSDSFFGIHKSHLLKQREECECHAKTSNKFSSAPQDPGHNVVLNVSDATSLHRSSSFLDALTKLADEDAYSSSFVQSVFNKSNGCSISDSSVTVGSPLNNVSTSAFPLSRSLQPPQTNEILEHAIVSPSGSWHQGYDDRSAIRDTCPTLLRTADFSLDFSIPQVTDKTQEAETITKDCSKNKTRGISRSDSTWNQRFIELQQFKSIHGHCNVPQKYEKNPSLGAWVARNRLFMRQWDAAGEKSRVSTVQRRRIKLLKEIGLVSCLGKCLAHLMHLVL